MSNEGRTENLFPAEIFMEQYNFLNFMAIQTVVLFRSFYCADYVWNKLFLLLETNQIQQYFRLCFFVFSGNYSKKFSILFLALEIINTFSFLL
jgi:hypothetical protein